MTVELSLSWQEGRDLTRQWSDRESDMSSRWLWEDEPRLWWVLFSLCLVWFGRKRDNISLWVYFVHVLVLKLWDCAKCNKLPGDKYLPAETLGAIRLLTTSLSWNVSIMTFFLKNAIACHTTQPYWSTSLSMYTATAYNLVLWSVITCV